MDGESALIPDKTGVRSRLRACLEDCDAVSAHALMQRLRLDRETLSGCLDGLIARGDVEVLRPISRGQDGGHAPRRDDEFYRLVRETDNDYLWQQMAVPAAPKGWAASAGTERGVYRRELDDADEAMMLSDPVFA
jgi:predicted ArsR family transcriptional regulator